MAFNSSQVPSAPEEKQKSLVTGLPPMMTLTFLRKPATSSLWTVSTIMLMVVVSMAESATKSGLCSMTAATKSSG